MSNQEFWEEDPDLFWAYRFSFYNTKKEEFNSYDYIAWLNGVYVYQAVSVALNNAFSKTKIEYPSKPYNEEKEIKDSVENDVINIQNRVAKVQAIFREKEKNKGKEE